MVFYAKKTQEGLAFSEIRRIKEDRTEIYVNYNDSPRVSMERQLELTTKRTNKRGCVV